MGAKEGIIMVITLCAQPVVHLKENFIIQPQKKTDK